ncbi:NAM domain-containing protein [Cephalotus follicularis]|uniref:NAM domain-containing protein n=1 Tax=Cephalotus follicularis TaxID=3775 RepID=A0A1Q3CS93_CEPFO|nr:NAM domain-containing protein [Cephalotus follicularis]
MGYLYNKALNLPVPSEYITDCDLYGDEDEWMKKFKDTGRKAVYFFVKMTKKTMNGPIIERKTACGSWKSNHRDEHRFYDEKNIRERIGSMRKFNYLPNEGFQAKGRWIMYEYSLDGLQLKKNDHVLCIVEREEETITPNTNNAIPEFSPSGEVKMSQSIPYRLGTTVCSPLKTLPKRVHRFEDLFPIPQMAMTQSMSPYMQEEIEAQSMNAQEQILRHDLESAIPQSMDFEMQDKSNINNNTKTIISQVSVMPPEVSVPILESTYPLPWGSDEKNLPRGDAEQMLLMDDESFWETPASMEDILLKNLKKALHNLNH